MIGILLLAAMLGQSAPPPRDTRAAATAPSASLSGRVTDDRGAPIGGALVVATGGPPLPGARTATTSDSGRYLIANLAAGLYTVSAIRNGYPPINVGQSGPTRPGRTIAVNPGQQLSLPIRLPRGAVISGTLVDDRGEPTGGSIVITPEWTVASKASRILAGATVNSRGVFRAYGLFAGTYRVSAAPPDVTGQADEPAGVMTVTVAAGEERSGIVLRREPARPTTYVTVSVTEPSGEQPRSVQVTLRRPNDPREISSWARPNPDGTRTLTDVSAGRYLVVARAGTSLGSAEVVVDGEHPASVAVRLSPGVRVRGKVTFDGAGIPPPRPSWVLVSPADTASLLTDNDGATGQVTWDGTFIVSGVPPGRYVLRAPLDSRSGWTLGTALLHDVDVADVPFTVAYDDIEGVSVTLTTRRALLSGTIKDGSGAPVNGIDVVVFPVDETLRVRNSRRVATSRTTVSGEYEIRDLPPGEYALALVDTVDSTALRDPALLKQLTPVSTVTVRVGETRHDVVVR